MVNATLRHIVLGFAAGGLLVGCVEGSNTGGTTAAESASPGLFAPRNTATARDVEAPEIFQTTDSALWDGRPSLGGIWVASPETTDPERVVMFNPATGKSVTGALFRRERDNPGPKLQISSDAAEALGILAGQPTQIKVTALRREEVAPVEAPVEAPVGAAVADVAAAPADPAAIPAATATSPASDPAATETAALAAAAIAAAEGVPAAAEAVETAADPVEAVEPPRRKTWAERRAEARAEREAARAAREAERTASEAAALGLTIDPAPSAEAGEPVDPSAGTVAAIETAPLDARAAEVAVAPAPTERKTRRQIREEEAAAAAAAAAVAAAPAETAPATAGRPIQIASFSREENAARAVEALAKADITARPQRSERNGAAVWGVVAVGDAALLDKIKAAGFADAYFLQ